LDKVGLFLLSLSLHGGGRGESGLRFLVDGEGVQSNPREDDGVKARFLPSP